MKCQLDSLDYKYTCSSVLYFDKYCAFLCRTSGIVCTHPESEVLFLDVVAH